MNSNAIQSKRQSIQMNNYNEQKKKIINMTLGPCYKKYLSAMLDMSQISSGHVL